MIRFRVPNGLEFQPCPLCQQRIALFQSYRGDAVVLNENGTLHVNTCSHFNKGLKDYHALVKSSFTTYDQLILQYDGEAICSALQRAHDNAQGLKRPDD